MRNMIWPLLLIVLSNCFYNICTKSVPEGVNTFGTLTITYLVGAVLNKRKVIHTFRQKKRPGCLERFNGFMVLLNDSLCFSLKFRTV